jgi:anti-sigma factor RsiW
VTCDHKHLLPGYADGELDLVRHLEVEQHLPGCAECAEALRQHQALRAALTDAGLYHRAPDGLRERVRSSLRRAEGARARGPLRPGRLLAAAAALAGVALITWGVARLRPLPSAEDQLAQEVVSGHVRSLMAGHLLDVPSTDRHKVKPWFNGRVDFSPEVKDLAAEGFPLAGGRLDYLDGHKTAALVYRRQQHVINLFVWHSPDAPDQEPRALTRQGYHLVHWAGAGLTYWAVSDLNESELREFVRLVRG